MTITSIKTEFERVQKENKISKKISLYICYQLLFYFVAETYDYSANVNVRTLSSVKCKMPIFVIWNPGMIMLICNRFCVIFSSFTIKWERKLKSIITCGFQILINDILML